MCSMDSGCARERVRMVTHLPRLANYLIKEKLLQKTAQGRSRPYNSSRRSPSYPRAIWNVSNNRQVEKAIISIARERMVITWVRKRQFYRFINFSAVLKCFHCRFVAQTNGENFHHSFVSQPDAENPFTASPKPLVKMMFSLPAFCARRAKPGVKIGCKTAVKMIV